MALVASKTSKRGDTGEAVRLQLAGANGPTDLRGKTCHFYGKVMVNGIPAYIDSTQGDGIVIVEEDEPGANAEKRGWVRFEPTLQGVDVTGLFEIEVEVVIDPNTNPPKKLTWPSAQNMNPGWQIDPDIK